MDYNKALNEFTAQYYQQLASGVYNKPMEVGAEDTALVIIDAQKCVTKGIFCRGLQGHGR